MWKVLSVSVDSDCLCHLNAGESANLWRELQEEETMEQEQVEEAGAEWGPGVFQTFLNGLSRHVLGEHPLCVGQGKYIFTAEA